ncbi:MAG TPA: hypothetical protein PKD85_00850, partial [Saprospiraceae bacterium]|nr:hypothetical protein [Saprospiraceae bacterium]
RLRWNFPHTPSLIWGLAIFGYAGVSIVFFIYTMVVPRYNNLYLQGQFEQHVYYIVQAVPTFLGALGLIIWLIFLIVSSCTELIPTEIALAKTQVVVPVKEISNVISKDAPLIDDYDVKLYQTNDLV